LTGNGHEPALRPFPVTAAVATATICRGFLLGSNPIFPVHSGDVVISATADTLCLVAGLTGGLLAIAATWLVYPRRRRLRPAADPLDVVATDRRRNYRHGRAG
jgi:H+/Cl- antiporter ClcA